MKTPEEIEKWHHEKKTPKPILKKIKLSFDSWRNKYLPKRKNYINIYFGKTGKTKRSIKKVKKENEQKLEEQVVKDK